MSFFSDVAGFLIQPFFWLLALLVLLFFVRKKKIRRLLVAAAVGVMLLFSNPFLHRIATHSWEPPPVPVEEIARAAPYEYGIVLGGFTRMYARPLDRLHLNDSANRFSQSLELYHQRKIKKLVFVSGSTTTGKPPLSEAELARDAAIRFGVPVDDIIALPKSRNTYENAIEFREFLSGQSETDSLLLITSASHMPRALACFRKQELNPDSFPTDYRSNRDPGSANDLCSLLIPNAATFTAWGTLFREWLAMATYRMRGRI